MSFQSSVIPEISSHSRSSSDSEIYFKKVSGDDCSNAYDSIQQNLFSYESDKIVSDNAINRDSYNDSYDSFRRMPSIGYEAHLDPINDSELNDWKRQFHYLRIEGRNCYNYDNTDSVVVQDIDMNNSNVDIPSFVAYGENVDLTVTGVKSTISTCHNQISDDETILEDGTLVDIIDINKASECLSSNYDDNTESMSPKSLHQQELIDLHFDEIWKITIPSIFSFVERVVKEYERQSSQIPNPSMSA